MVATKISTEMIILSFWTKCTQKRYLQFETEQTIQGLQAIAFYVVNFNSTVVSFFEFFERKIGYILPPGLFLS